MEVRPGMDQEAAEQVKKRWVPVSRYTWKDGELDGGDQTGRRYDC